MLFFFNVRMPSLSVSGMWHFNFILKHFDMVRWGLYKII